MNVDDRTAWPAPPNLSENAFDLGLDAVSISAGGQLGPGARNTPLLATGLASSARHSAGGAEIASADGPFATGIVEQPTSVERGLLPFVTPRKCERATAPIAGRR